MAAPIIASQTCDFGAKTLINAGAYQLVNTGDGVDTIGTVTGTSSSEYTVAVVSDEIVITATASGTASSGTLIIANVTGLDATNIGTVTVTVTAIADSFSITGITELNAAMSVTTLGDVIYTRDFWSNSDSSRADVWGVPSGTWDGTNYVNVTPHTGAVTKIGSLWLNGTSDGCKYFQFEDIDFTSSGVAQGAIIFIYQGARFFKFLNCRFKCTVADGTGSVWVGAITTNNNASEGIKVVGCDFSQIGGQYNVMSLRGSNCEVSSCTTELGVGQDFMQINGPTMDNLVIEDNVVSIKYLFNAVAHGDFFQIVASSLTKSMENVSFQRNTMIRGQDINDYDDGQGFFFGSYGSYNIDGAVIKNNLYVGSLARAVSLRGDDVVIQYNTLLFDEYADAASATTKNSGIYMDAGDTITISNNCMIYISTAGCSNVTTTNNQLADWATVSPAPDSYDELFNAPKGGGSLTAANYVDSYKAKTGGLLDTNTIGVWNTAGVYNPAAVVSEIDPQFIPMGIGPDADIPHFILLGLSAGSVAPTGTGDAQGDRHRTFNALHGGAIRTYNGDVVAGCLANEPTITATTFNGVLGQWLALKGYTNDTLNGRMNAFAIAQGAEKWSGLGTFTV